MKSRRPARAPAAPPPLFHEADLKAPHPLLVLLEGRAPWEYAAMLAAMPWLRRLPRGDGHPVIVYPGLGATDLTHRAAARVPADLGYSAYPWKQGFNFGPRHGVLEAACATPAGIAARHDDKVSLIGWSLGGIYAREMAKEPELARCVITLGTPFTGHPRATNAWRFYEWSAGRTCTTPS
jgi:pimeloyl-ACP methyl ester carboxylesterase